MTDKHDSAAQSVAELLASAQQRVIIVSAFIRSETLDFLLSSVRKNVNICVYARWRIADIAAGASDVAVIDVAKRRGAEFRVYDALHAKIYIADDKALVGSANATDAGLGRRVHGSNLEILIESSADCFEIQKVLDVLGKESLIPRRFSDKDLDYIQHYATGRIDANAESSDDNWLPSSSPEAVLRAGQDAETLLDNDVLQDCYALGVGAGTTQERLAKIVRTRRVFFVLSDALEKEYKRALSSDKIISAFSESFKITRETAAKKWDIVQKWVDMFSDTMYIIPAKDGSAELRRGQKMKFNAINRPLQNR